MNNYIIYMHTNKINGKIYIGQTCQDLKKRAGSNGLCYRECHRFYEAIKKYGWNNFEHTILLMGLSAEEANEIEMEMIAETNACNPDVGYNIASGGLGMTPERSRALWSNPEYRARISEANKKIWANEEYRKNVLLYIKSNGKTQRKDNEGQNKQKKDGQTKTSTKK